MKTIEYEVYTVNLSVLLSFYSNNYSATVLQMLREVFIMLGITLNERRRVNNAVSDTVYRLRLQANYT